MGFRKVTAYEIEMSRSQLFIGDENESKYKIEKSWIDSGRT